MVWSETFVLRQRRLVKTDAVENKRLRWFRFSVGFAQR